METKGFECENPTAPRVSLAFLALADAMRALAYRAFVWTGSPKTALMIRLPDRRRTHSDAARISPPSQVQFCVHSASVSLAKPAFPFQRSVFGASRPRGSLEGQSARGKTRSAVAAKLTQIVTRLTRFVIRKTASLETSNQRLRRPPHRPPSRRLWVRHPSSSRDQNKKNEGIPPGC